jgi:hypothetical protein
MIHSKDILVACSFFITSVIFFSFVYYYTYPSDGKSTDALDSLFTSTLTQTKTGVNVPEQYRATRKAVIFQSILSYTFTTSVIAFIVYRYTRK